MIGGTKIELGGWFCRLSLASLMILPIASLAEERARDDLEKEIERLRIEAAPLIQMLIRDNFPHQNACMFDSTWSSRAVDVVLARRYLGSNLLADVSAPHSSIAPSDIIDPTKKMPGYFCSATEATERWKQRLSEFQIGRDAGEPDGAPDRQKISQLRIEISLPVFDAAFTTAIVVLSTWREAAARGPAGQSKRLSPEGSGFSFVYKKQAEGWIQIDRTEDYSAN
ncbi:conserved hypothetical protein [Hyphomicrobiales bacterium]|nr:conserved hypothetical protein [Hyphomicrobiales bacterium]CAH1700979.1 conserved hypothetical protein [Hyphomicrobiales bacterium]CAI0344857.1 conserved hypothetical protein [Hyphomicrobiales bacterium]